MKKPLLLIDFGGVAVRKGPRELSRDWSSVLVDKATPLSVFFDHPSSWRAMRGECSADHALDELALRLGLTRDRVDFLWGDFWSGQERDELLLNYLSGQRNRASCVVCSNFWDNYRSVFVNMYSLDADFDSFVVSADVRTKKPDPEFYSTVAGMFPDHPRRLLVDDYCKNVEAARRMGWDGIVHLETSATIQAIAGWLEGVQTGRAASRIVPSEQDVRTGGAT